MPQPVVSDVHVNAPLTQISVGYIQSTDNYIADKVFPMVPVQHKSDLYFKWSKSDFLRDDMLPRADGTESAGTGVNLTTDSYLAVTYGLHKDIGPQVRANADPAVDLDASVTKALTQKGLIKRDRIFATNYIKTGLWGTDITGVASAPSGSQAIYWNDDANSDPFTDIATGQTTILQNTGMEANVLALSWPVYQVLRKHPLVIDRIKYTTPAFAGKVTPELLAQAFDIDRVVVAKAVYNSAAEGATDSFSFIIGKHALLCYANPAPGLMEPSAGYIFPWEGLTGLNSLGVQVYQIPMDWLGRGTIRDEIEMAFDMKAVSTDCGYFFSGIVQ